MVFLIVGLLYLSSVIIAYLLQRHVYIHNKRLYREETMGEFIVLFPIVGLACAISLFSSYYFAKYTFEDKFYQIPKPKEEKK